MGSFLFGKERIMVIEKTRNAEKVIAIIKSEGGNKMVIKGYKDGLNVLAIVRDKFGNIKNRILGRNIVTNAGDLFYAEMAAGEVVTNAFANCILGTGAGAEDKGDDFADVSKIANTEKAPTATYPMTDDADVDNTGAAVDSVTYKYEWSGADFAAASIVCGAIVVAAASGTDPLLTRFKFGAAFEKTATDTLTLYVNHNFLGV